MSRSGPSLSFGPRGAKFTVGPRGTRTTFGIPGTGLYYTSTNSGGAQSRSRSRGPAPQPAPPASHLDLGFFERLVTPPEEQQFVDGLRQMAGGNKDAALGHLMNASHLADGALMAGWLCLEKQDFFRAERYLDTALTRESEIGKLFGKYGISPHIELAVADELTAHLSATPTAARLAMAAVFQRQQRWQEALDILKQLYQAHPEDMVIRLSVVELLMHIKPNDRSASEQVVRLSEGVADDSEVHAAICSISRGRCAFWVCWLRQSTRFRIA